MPTWLAAAVVFFTSGSVLVLEILAGRLLAPYVGVRLETYTSVIGIVLGGIALGTWLGGRLADKVDPRRTLGPLMVAGGGLAMLSPAVVHATGHPGLGSPGDIVGLATIGFFAPAAVLSAVSPTIVKLVLRDLGVTGQVVGRLSAIGTAGAIVGTFVAGFVLVAAAATSTVIIAVGAALVVTGLVLWVGLARPRPPAALLALSLAAAAGTGTLGAVSRGPCDVETRYHCARIIPDPARPGGRSLWLDITRHSYVDLRDPKHLELRYAKVFADVIAASRPSAAGAPPPFDALHIGGGGFTLPRYLTAVYPGSRHVVFELDPDLVDLARRRLGLVTGPGIRIEAGDARLLTRRLPDDSQDVVIGDAFGDLSVPWHLTTREFLTDLRRVLRPDGVYVLNLIDYTPLRFARSETATLAAVFRHVAVLAPPPFLAGQQGGNFVLAASDHPFDVARLEALIQFRGGQEQVAVDTDATTFAADGRLLTDDYAPVDQWLARSRS
ncbi:MAG TPA: fused MFS/spermidine synthase [Acidimicrobiia bacterium]|nr:fused MFS/spermidine synthase [Acidimicrobiia bacterium]